MEFKRKTPGLARLMPAWLKISTAIALTALLPFGLPPAALAAEPPNLTGNAAALLDAATGKVLYAKNGDARKGPASTTKILTALIALEKGQLTDVLKVGKQPPEVEGTRVYLEAGESVTLENLLYGLMVNSGNDAAIVIAEHFGGTEENFANLMTARAAELGAKDSRFVTASGLSEPGHYTTARDLGLIACAAMQNETFKKIVATKTRVWKSKSWDTELVNHNRLLWRYEGADGIKTGYTRDSRYTMVGSATRKGQTLIAVVLEAPESRAAEADAMALLDYGFSEFSTYRLVRAGAVVASVDLGEGKVVEVEAARDLAVVLKNDGAQPVASLRLSPLQGPLPARSKAGEVVYRHGGEVVGSVEVLTRQAIPVTPLQWQDWWVRVTAGLAGLYVLYAALGWRRRRKLLARRRLSGRLPGSYAGLER